MQQTIGATTAQFDRVKVARVVERLPCNLPSYYAMVFPKASVLVELAYRGGWKSNWAIMWHSLTILTLLEEIFTLNDIPLNRTSSVKDGAHGVAMICLAAHS